MTPSVDVDLVINCYERTYRDLLAPGVIAGIAASNMVDFHSRIVLVNNVVDRADVAGMVLPLLKSGEIDGCHSVASCMPYVGSARLPARAFRRHPYLLDYGVAMGVAASATYVLGWDAEVRLVEPADWVTGAVDLLGRRRDVFSAACRWPARVRDTLDDETVDVDGDWRLNWGFSDQMFLIRRADLASPIYRSFAPGGWARNNDHPWTFESRVESYQRAHRRYRATTAAVRYEHNDAMPEVMGRLGGRTVNEYVQHRVLRRARRTLQRVPASHPRWSAR